MNSKQKFTIKSPDGQMNKELTIEAYKKNDCVVVSYNQIRAFYQQHRSEYGVTVDIKFCDSKLNDKGQVGHAFTCVEITDKNGYTASHVGEITSAEMDAFAQKFPLSVATNRAISAALLTYFGFPEKSYTTMQVMMNDRAGDVATPNENVETNTDTAQPEVSKEAPIENKYATPEIGDDESIPYSEAPASEVTFPDAKDTKIEYPNKEEKAAEPPVENANSESNKPTEAPAKVEDITISSKIGFGKYPSITIAELYEKKKAGDDFAVRFVAMIKAGKIRANDENGEEVIKFIRSYSE